VNGPGRTATLERLDRQEMGSSSLGMNCFLEQCRNDCTFPAKADYGCRHLLSMTEIILSCSFRNSLSPSIPLTTETNIAGARSKNPYRLSRLDCLL
jgi:hypothetical protein